MASNVLDERQRTLLQDGLAPIPDAATFLGISRSTIYCLMDDGRLPFVLLGKRRLIPRRALIELAATGLR